MSNPAETTPSPAPGARRRQPPRLVEVVRSERVGPAMQRVTLGGPALDGFAITSPTAYIKLFLPVAGQREPALPTIGPNGPVFPEGADAPTVRTYTPRRFSAERQELDVEFFLHGTGPASDWAVHAQPGDRVGVGGPGRGYELDPSAEWFVLAGDETAIPAIGVLIEELPEGTPAVVVVEVESADHHEQLPERPGVEVQWAYRGALDGGAALEAAVRGLTIPSGDGRVWVATEAGAVRRIRAFLLGERGIPVGSLMTRGYWRAGAANHPDHDYGDD